MGGASAAALLDAATRNNDKEADDEDDAEKYGKEEVAAAAATAVAKVDRLSAEEAKEVEVEAAGMPMADLTWRRRVNASRCTATN